MMLWSNRFYLQLLPAFSPRILDIGVVDQGNWIKLAEIFASGLPEYHGKQQLIDYVFNFLTYFSLSSPAFGTWVHSYSPCCSFSLCFSFFLLVLFLLSSTCCSSSPPHVVPPLLCALLFFSSVHYSSSPCVFSVLFSIPLFSCSTPFSMRTVLLRCSVLFLLTSTHCPSSPLHACCSPLLHILFLLSSTCCSSSPPHVVLSLFCMQYLFTSV
jgi:hypothetical protein